MPEAVFYHLSVSRRRQFRRGADVVAEGCERAKGGVEGEGKTGGKMKKATGRQCGRLGSFIYSLKWDDLALQVSENAITTSIATR